ncbi:hypothetical protein GGE65_005682 [Skermanella aerolata]|uniref:Uncharacterized protein n=1 Tax=Skermanella aerolata TaxID=393310 RepID=A0A512DYE0_9PROT|nr:hypothetical protein [Skermanella aerolata]KJB93341.1 hypothetical protein N826_18180 [Skermanella aerolata KACC 11604]GEO41475.1 hypothetical protein SAE02_56230 [Skermanella aerolata]
MSPSTAAAKNVARPDPVSVFDFSDDPEQQAYEQRAAAAFAAALPEILALYDSDPEVAMEKSMVAALRRTVEYAERTRIQAEEKQTVAAE